MTKLRRLSIERMAPGNTGHYKGTFQPIDLSESFDLRFTEGNIVKYTCRHRDKFGLEDVKKVIWYLQVLWSRSRAGYLKPYLEVADLEEAIGFCEVQKIGANEAKIIECVFKALIPEYATAEGHKALFNEALIAAENIQHEYIQKGMEKEFRERAHSEEEQRIETLFKELDEIGDDEVKRRTIEDLIFEIKPSPEGAAHPERFHLENERLGKTVVFQIGKERGYFTVNWYNDGNPGEVFIRLGKEGSESRGFADCWAIAISMLLQYGVDPRKIYDKFKEQQFEPAGMTGVNSVPMAKSVVDLIMKWMERNLPPTAQPKKPGADEYDEIIETVGG